MQNDWLSQTNAQIFLFFFSRYLAQFLTRTSQRGRTPAIKPDSKTMAVYLHLEKPNIGVFNRASSESANATCWPTSHVGSNLLSSESQTIFSPNLNAIARSKKPKFHWKLISQRHLWHLFLQQIFWYGQHLFLLVSRCRTGCYGLPGWHNKPQIVRVWTARQARNLSWYSNNWYYAFWKKNPLWCRSLWNILNKLWRITRCNHH